MKEKPLTVIKINYKLQLILGLISIFGFYFVLNYIGFNWQHFNILFSSELGLVGGLFMSLKAGHIPITYDGGESFRRKEQKVGVFHTIGLNLIFLGFLWQIAQMIYNHALNK